MSSDRCRHLSNFRRTIQSSLRITFSRKFKALLTQNQRLQGAFSGKRCVILGNGPSLRQTNFDLIRNEIVFTVNELPRSDLFRQIHPRFHVFIDPDYGQLSQDHQAVGDFRQLLDRLAEVPGLTCIGSYAFIESIKRLSPPGMDWITYYNRLDPVSNFPMSFSLTGMMPQAQTVVLAAGWTALSMGFRSIIFAGVDMTGFLEYYLSPSSSPASNPEDYRHPYALQREYADWATETTMVFDNERWLRATAEMFRQFKAFAYQARLLGCEVYNATEGGSLDTFPRRTLQQVLD